MNMTPNTLDNFMKDCTLCPRNCHANRLEGGVGFCGQTAHLTAARAALHFWEEPCISGAYGDNCPGSGTVFFSGCNLQCVFCQNHDIANGGRGKIISLERLSEIFLELQEKGAANINLVTGTHFIPQICVALDMAKKKGLQIPVVYNSSGYEEVSSLELLDGLVDIYLPDLKYVNSELSQRYSHAPNYFEKASLALSEMYRQVGSATFDPETGLMTKGMIVRHLLLPGESGDSKRVLRYLYNTFGNDIYISIMNQYTPMPHVMAMVQATTCNAPDYIKLTRRVTPEEYEKIIAFAESIGIENAFIQEGDTADESFIPDFDGEGL